MLDVKLICIYNQFDANGGLYLADFDEDTRRHLCALTLDNISSMVNEYSHEYEINDILMLGDNKEFLTGLKEQILSDYALNYANEQINITILGK